MNGKDIELSRRRVLGGIATVGAASAAAGAGTFALFSDTESSTENSIQAGTLDLTVNEADTWTFNLSNAKPTDQTGVATLDVVPGGSLTGDHVELSFAVTETESTPASPNDTQGGDTNTDTSTGADGMATLFRVDTLTYGSYNLAQDVTDTNGNGNGILDLDDVVQAGVFDGRDASGTNTLSIQLTFIDPDTNGDYTGSLTANDFQGDELGVIVNAALTQDANQDVLPQN